ncbi:carboxymuconolactone decarboxylase family protein [Vibrio fluvialis]|uniref:carboxymuconolactone decarboxylase family protein n=1 Tax=Vibrio fluvialis TaxID=676 RepID=UPI001EEA4EAF|nr:carboxymuconolactone decarboxylase family protein [Vibrio fluvialis]
MMTSKEETLLAMFADTSPQFHTLTLEVLFGQVWADPSLSQRDRSLITVAALVALNRTEQLPGHLQRARNNGLSAPELSAVMTHLAFYAGWPAAASALERLAETESSRDC